jgi:precorrin-4 methylase
MMTDPSRHGHLIVVGLPATGDADDLSINAHRAIRDADKVVYPGVNMDSAWTHALDLESKLATGTRLSTNQLNATLVSSLRTGATVALLVQGDPSWMTAEPGVRASVFDIAARLEAAGHRLTILPGVGGIAATCAAARLDLLGQPAAAGVTVSAPVGQEPGVWAKAIGDDLATGRTTVALMAEHFTTQLLHEIERRDLTVTCWVGSPHEPRLRHLLLPSQASELLEVREPATLILRSTPLSLHSGPRANVEFPSELRRSVVVLVEDPAAFIAGSLLLLGAHRPPPDEIVLVTDHRAPLDSRLGAQLQTILPPTTSHALLSNSRTSGCNGCWNTGLLRIVNSGYDPADSMVSLLDGRRPWDDATSLNPEPNSSSPLGLCARLDQLLMAGLLNEDSTEPGFPDLLTRLESVGVEVMSHIPPTLHEDPSVAAALKQTSARAPDLAPPPAPEAFSLYAGIISADPGVLEPLLLDLSQLRRQPYLDKLVAVVLDNGAAPDALRAVQHRACSLGLEVALVSERRQQRDTTASCFGHSDNRPRGQVGIGQARTMLQRYVGQLMNEDPGSYGWILDDDMRIDDRANAYLPWLPSFRSAGVHAVIGSYEGSSPNPPMNGLRVQLVDLWHNLTWLQSLPPTALLPDRGGHNRRLRQRFPDYYYDLSRKHTAHVETVHWLEPIHAGETVGQAEHRLVDGALGLLSGAALTRPVYADMPADPIAAAKDSVNRGGNTFIMDPRALTQSPNAVVRMDGKEARRSDMVWAILNRYYRGLSIKQVAFPVLHRGRVTREPSINLDKVTSEIVGSAFYGAFTDHLDGLERHDLRFDQAEVDHICGRVGVHVERRLRALRLSYYRIRGLTAALTRVQRSDELGPLVTHLREWFTPEVFESIAADVRTVRRDDFAAFVHSLRDSADDYAGTAVNVDFIHEQIQFNSH